MPNAALNEIKNKKWKRSQGENFFADGKDKLIMGSAMKLIVFPSCPKFVCGSSM